jgi:hypothetical protein
MHDEVYTDGIGEVTITGSVVRVDLMSYSVTERDAQNQPVLAFRQRLIFPIAAFANSVELMQKALNSLLEAGAIRRSAAQGAPAPTTLTPALAPALTPALALAPGTEPASPPRRNTSLNFP